MARLATRHALLPQGFTVIEMLVVVTIIGILAAFAAPRIFAHVRASESAEAALAMGRIATGIRAYSGSQTKPASVMKGELDKTTLTRDGSGSKEITAYIPYLRLPPDANFDYEIKTKVGDAGTTQEGEVVFCITATGRSTAGMVGGKLLYSSTRTKAPGWDDHMNRVPYVNGDTTIYSAQEGGYCNIGGHSYHGHAQTTCTDC